MKVAFVLYPDFTGLDLVGPYDVISRWPGAEVHFVARTLDPMRADRGLTVIPTDIPETLPDPDVIVVPGSENPLPVMEDRVLLDWLRAAAPGCRWTVSIEYDPQPPFDSGSPDKASPATRRLAKRILLGDHPVRAATRYTRQIVGARIGRARKAVSR